MDILKIEELNKTYHTGKLEKKVLTRFDYTMKKGELVAFMGPSGSGKTTLLNLICGIDKADSGNIYIDGENVCDFSNKERLQFRRTKVGLVFQDYHLVDSLNIEDNIILPMTLEGKFEDEIQERLQELVHKFCIENMLMQYPATLSGGEKQRAAICRALSNHPVLLLADEPTGNLDIEATKNVMLYFREIQSESSILMVTHDAYAASFCDRVVFFTNGKIHKEICSEGDNEVLFTKILSEMSKMGGTQS